MALLLRIARGQSLAAARFSRARSDSVILTATCTSRLPFPIENAWYLPHLLSGNDSIAWFGTIRYTSFPQFLPHRKKAGRPVDSTQNGPNHGPRVLGERENMADKQSSTGIHLVGLSRPEIPTNNLAIEALAIARECVQALQRYHAETEIRLGGIADLLASLEGSAIRAIRRGQ
jgi:hypothetical protein